MALTHVTYIDDEYRIEVSALKGRVAVVVNGVQVAESSAARVLSETYLPPCVYIPRDDVDEKLLKRSTFRTFCPFKGTATHWSLNLPSGLVENACWAYDAPRHAGTEVGGMLSFYPNLIDRLEGDDEVLEILRGDDSEQPEPPKRLTDWILMQAWLITDPAELTRQLAHRLIEGGMPLMRLNIGIWTLHP